jgi:hypothetical protein
MKLFFLAAVGAAALGTAAVPASILVASGAARGALRVDARANAEVIWFRAGTRRTLLVPVRGRVLPGGGLPGRDVSRPARRDLVAMARVVRRTPDGYLWALQEWTPVPGKPPELRLARWRGQPTNLTLTVSCDRVAGQATFAGRPVSGFTTTPAGKRLRIYVYLDCSGCPGAGLGWKRMLGVAPRSDGSFSVLLRPEWTGSRYRATVTGPNRGTTRAPDARTVASAA